MEHFLVNRDHFQMLVSEVQNGSARRLVNTAILHAHQTILNDVDNANAVLAAQLVKLLDNLRNFHLLAINGNGNASFKIDGHIRRLVGCLHRRHAHFQEAFFFVLRLVRRIFQVKTLMGQMPQVLILGIAGLARNLQRNIMRFGVIDLLVAGLDIPLAPRGDNLQIGSETLDSKLKTHLVVALARCAVNHGIGTFCQRNLGQLLTNHRACKRSAQQVSFILGIHLQRGNDNLIAHFVNQIGHDKLRSARCQRLLFQALKLISLAHVTGNGNNLGVVIVFLQPRNDNRRIQATGVRQDNLFDVFLSHLFLQKS